MPDIPLSEVLGNTGTVPVPQITRLVPKLKVGTTLGITVTVSVRVSPHWFAEGVNV